jgi:hypothetical protein
LSTFKPSNLSQFPWKSQSGPWTRWILLADSCLWNIPGSTHVFSRVTAEGTVRASTCFTQTQCRNAHYIFLFPALEELFDRGAEQIGEYRNKRLIMFRRIGHWTKFMINIKRLSMPSFIVLKQAFGIRFQRVFPTLCNFSHFLSTNKVAILPDNTFLKQRLLPKRPPT